uniref:PH domain-containing protein n=1 Tax=Anopheles christyi TaxID=43041 RepID=A0A182KFF9_9DIPT
MKKFMTTTKTPAAVAGSSPTPPPTFSFAVMLQQQGAARNGSPASGERTEDIAGGRLSATPAAIQPVTPLDGSAATAPSKEARTTKGSSLGRLPTTAKDTSTFTTSSTPSSTGAVKMCGYLKKKRNKMGGWRKLFFILQNQLLLSYSSRDDYEKRLAPFKDIINLVPGTIIIPTTGPRFTIETNSKLMYTFRCDDHRSCSEWIMALLDSLTVANGGLSTDRNFSLHNSFHRSTLPLTSFSLPSNCKPFAGVIGRSSGPALGLLKKRAPQPLLECSGPPKPPRCFQPEMAGRSPSASYLSVAHESNDEDDLNNNVLSGNLLQDGKCLATNSLSKSRDNGPKLFGSGDDGDSR